MAKKKKLMMDQYISGKDYRMFIVKCDDIAEVKKVVRWSRKGCIGTFCTSQILSEKQTFHSRMSGAKSEFYAYVGFTNDDDSMAMQLSFDMAKEVPMWPSTTRFSVYVMSDD